MIPNRTGLQVWSAIALVSCALAAGADTTGRPRLKMFGDQPNPHGLWKMELIEASDQTLVANAKKLSETAICMDAASEMGQGVKPTETKCTHSVVKDTSAEAEIEKQCPGVTTVMTMRRESKESILVETVERGKAGIISTMKGRYRYAGPCDAGDSLLKLDKDSDICQRARAEAAQANPESVCGDLEGAQKTDCIKRIESALATSRQLCE
jgi:hypothetical protein